MVNVFFAVSIFNERNFSTSKNFSKFEKLSFVDDRFVNKTPGRCIETKLSSFSSFVD